MHRLIYTRCLGHRWLRMLRDRLPVGQWCNKLPDSPVLARAPIGQLELRPSRLRAGAKHIRRQAVCRRVCT